MIFLSGIHGSGKSYLCKELNKYNIPTCSASHLIAKYKKEAYSSNKLTNNIDDNQCVLIKAMNSLNDGNHIFWMDICVCLMAMVKSVELIVTL